ncbi:glycosyltransferase family 4 protein [Methanoculleus oceani]|uniref:Glycosyltransferase subfamily 4-like N-terminal domain-containing protein n=1 Tax=Methanoculleus oceani TaxID=2184756 RepID=A0ABD4TDS9_9EURY|nr:glycosyltransferase family 4 protein [Methanoculleus sp. CWC-02]MCM2465673.1 hypothetical protein [Methanoculleus sp. CWC-02]
MNVVILDAHREGDARIERHTKYLVDQGLNIYRVHYNYKSDSAKPGAFSRYGEKGFRINISILQGKIRTLYFLGYCLRRKMLKDCLEALEVLGFDPAQPSVIHVHDPQLLPLAGMLVKGGLQNSRVVYDRHEVYEVWKQYLGISTPAFYEGLGKNVISGAVAVSEHHIDTVQRLFPASCVVAVPNYPLPEDYDDEVINRKIDPANSEAPINAVYVGSLNNMADRDVSLLLNIADAAIRSYDNVTFFVGGTSLDEDSKAKIDALAGKHDGRFRFFGRVPREETVELTEKAHIGFLLIRPDVRYWVRTSPNKIYEYLICGTVPIVRADVDHADLLRSCSLIFDRSDDDEAIVSAVLDLLGDPGRLRKLMTAARELGVTFTWESVACRYIGLYKTLLQSGAAPDQSARGIPLDMYGCET